MPGAEIERLLDDLEMEVNEARSPSFSGAGKKIVDADVVYNIIDDIKAAYPEEFARARRVLKEREEMLASAEAEANHIINDAKEQALILAGEQEVVRLAQQRAIEVEEAAREFERDTRYSAEDYADQVFAHLEDNMTNLISSVSRCREMLNSQSGENNTSNTVNW